MRSDAQVGRGYAPGGETPEIRLNTQRARVNHIASIDNQGGKPFPNLFDSPASRITSCCARPNKVIC
ncbi:MAG: hypothetical protein HC881_09575 [Leptolyngbyaceae cyanobacterium SL_7_1]|nr:hypothetical protein [Leptolyngbyaceae cyanobacterium SL_7_1]